MAGSCDCASSLWNCIAFLMHLCGGQGQRQQAHAVGGWGYSQALDLTSVLWSLLHWMKRAMS
jgi:hypothetical protein